MSKHMEWECIDPDEADINDIQVGMRNFMRVSRCERIHVEMTAPDSTSFVDEIQLILNSVKIVAAEVIAAGEIGKVKLDPDEMMHAFLQLSELVKRERGS